MSTRTNNALLQSFSVNNLNQFTNSSRSGTLTVAGTSSSAATNVTVKDNANAAVAAILYGDTTFARTNVTVLNGTNTFTAVATSATRGDTNVVTVNLPSSVAYLHDANGNLTNDVARTFVYDDENELTSVSAAGAWKVDFVYDGRMRRRVRKDYLWNGSSFVQTNEVRYVYDGLVVLQERNANNLPQVSYTRGRDLGGGLQRAGGIGGLLARTDNTMLYTQPTAATAYYHADGNGNITALMSQQQVLVGKYLYDSFGNLLSKAGSMANANTIRFSSEEYFEKPNFYGYPYRYYEPNLQRWLSRDPLFLPEIFEGSNLYAFTANDPIDFVDIDGRGKFGLALRVGKWGVKYVKRLTKDEAKRLYKKEGEDIIASKSQIKKWGKRKGCEKPEIEKHEEGQPHGHPPDRVTHYGNKGGHGFVGSLAGLTAVGYFGDTWLAEAVDFFNPISDVVDIIGIIDDLSNPELSE